MTYCTDVVNENLDSKRVKHVETLDLNRQSPVLGLFEEEVLVRPMRYMLDTVRLVLNVSPSYVSRQTNCIRSRVWKRSSESDRWRVSVQCNCARDDAYILMATSILLPFSLQILLQVLQTTSIRGTSKRLVGGSQSGQVTCLPPILYPSSPSCKFNPCYQSFLSPF